MHKFLNHILLKPAINLRTQVLRNRVVSQAPIHSRSVLA